MFGLPDTKEVQAKPPVAYIHLADGTNNEPLKSKTAESPISKCGINFVILNLLTCISIGIFVTSFWFIQVYSGQDKEICFLVSRSTRNVTEYGQTVVRAISDYTTIVSRQNENTTTAYLNEVEGFLQMKSREFVKILDQVLKQTNTEINSEWYRLSSTTAAQLGNLTREFQSDLTKLKSTSNNIKNETDVLLNKFYISMDNIYESTVEYAISKLTTTLEGVLEYISTTFNTKITNPYEGRNFCRQISRQNNDTFQNLLILYKVHEFGTRMRKVVLDEYVNDSCTQDWFLDSSSNLLATIQDCERMMESILYCKDNFFGTLLQVKAEVSYLKLSQTIENNYTTVVYNFLDQLKVFTASQRLVNEESLNILKSTLAEMLQGVNYTNNDIGVFVSSKLHMGVLEKMEAMSEFWYIKFNIRYTKLYYEVEKRLLQAIFQSDAFVSSISIQNFLSVNLCPSEFDFQNFLIASQIGGKTTPFKQNISIWETFLDAIANFINRFNVDEIYMDVYITED